MAHCPSPLSLLLSESSSKTGLILVDVGGSVESGLLYCLSWFPICEFILDYVPINHCKLYKNS